MKQPRWNRLRDGLQDLISRYRLWVNLLYFALAALVYNYTHKWNITAVLVLVYLYLMAFGHSGKPAEPEPENAEGKSHGLLPALIISSAIIAGVAVFNFVINPYGIYPLHLFEPITFSTTRIQKIELLNAYEEPPQVVIYGSSRSFEMPPDMIQDEAGLSAFNASVTLGSPRDYYAFTRYLIRSDRIPQFLIIGLGVEQVSGDMPDIGEPGDPLRAYLEPSLLVGSLISTVDKAERLLTFEQLGSSIQLIDLSTKGDSSPQFRMEADGFTDFLHPDGVQLPLQDNKLDIWNPTRIFQGSTLDQTEVSYLEDLLRIAQENDISVIVYLPPYHPALMARFHEVSHFGDLNEQMLALFDAWQGEYPVHVYDFRDSAQWGITERMFLDTEHPSEEANRIMLETLLEQVGEGSE